MIKSSKLVTFEGDGIDLHYLTSLWGRKCFSYVDENKDLLLDKSFWITSYFLWRFCFAHQCMKGYLRDDVCMILDLGLVPLIYVNN